MRLKASHPLQGVKVGSREGGKDISSPRATKDKEQNKNINPFGVE